MHDVSMLRLYVLRATYLLLAVGLGLMVGPGLLRPPADLAHRTGVVRAMLGAVGLLALLGLRYPLRLLPLLFFELVWKSVWLLVFALPLWRADALDGAFRATTIDCLFGVTVCLVAIPWGYVGRRYVREPGSPWRRGVTDPQGLGTVAARAR